MNRHLLSAAVGGVVCSTLLVGTSLTLRAQDRPAAQDQAAMMKAWTEFASPGPEHKRMAEMVGDWTASIEDHTSGAVTTSQGSATFSMILGGRYLYQEFKGQMGPMSFEGKGYTAYDNAKKAFVDVWLDSAGTGVTVAHGTRKDERSIEGKGTMTMPGAGEIKYRTLTTIPDKDHQVYEMFGPLPNGTEGLMIKISYTRKK